MKIMKFYDISNNFKIFELKKKNLKKRKKK